MAGCQALLRSPNDVVEKDAGVCKLFQTETIYALRGTVGSADRAGVRCLGIISNALTWVQSAESCTAKVTKRALERVTAPSQMSSAIPLRTRLATCDEASSNLACEKAFQNDRGDGWTNLLLSCDTQSAAGWHGKTASLVSEDITGMLNVALACRMAEGIRKFRRCVREHVRSKIAWTEASRGLRRQGAGRPPSGRNTSK